MAYVDVNFKSKAALKRAIAAGEPVGVFSPSSISVAPSNGEVAVEGPHYPAPHTWYAMVRVVDGLVVRVLS